MNMISGISSLLILADLTPIQSILSMLVLFVSSAIYLYNSGFELMGVLYVLIYVGAIAILFLFIVSLLKIEHISNKLRPSPLVAILLCTILLPLDLSYQPMEVIEMSEPRVYAELANVGLYLYTDYALALIFIAIILVLSVIGAIIVTRK